MIKPIVKDLLFLRQKSEPATKEDIGIIDDLVDNLRLNLESCVDMVANIIGVKKCILVFSIGNIIVPMVNPVIVKKEKGYETEESCLSLTGFRKITRYEIIEVECLDRNFKKHKEKFSGFTAQIIQHEVYQFDGRII